LLRSLPHGEDDTYIFAGRDAGRCVGNNSMRDTMQRQLGATETVHGFRTSFRTWGGNKGYRREVLEAAIAHKINDQAERAYCQSNYLDERRTMMTAWANHCDGAPVADNVRQLRALKAGKGAIRAPFPFQNLMFCVASNSEQPASCAHAYIRR